MLDTGSNSFSARPVAFRRFADVHVPNQQLRWKAESGKTFRKVGHDRRSDVIFEWNGIDGGPFPVEMKWRVRVRTVVRARAQCTDIDRTGLLRRQVSPYRNGVSPGQGARSFVSGREISQMFLILRGAILSRLPRPHSRSLRPDRVSAPRMQNRRACGRAPFCR